MARVKWISGSYCQMTMTGTELALIRSALCEAERVSRLRIEVLGETDCCRDGKSPDKRALHRKIDALAMREASLRSLRKTLSELSYGDEPTSSQHAAQDQRRSALRALVPPPRRAS